MASIERLDNDIVPVERPYCSPTADATYTAFDFAKQGKIPREHRGHVQGGESGQGACMT